MRMLVKTLQSRPFKKVFKVSMLSPPFQGKRHIVSPDYTKKALKIQGRE